jgi:isocitrate/isopropylmalate dehydrogenase
MSTKIVTLPGDGIGPEVVDAAVAVLAAAEEEVIKASAWRLPSELSIDRLPSHAMARRFGVAAVVSAAQQRAWEGALEPKPAAKPDERAAAISKLFQDLSPGRRREWTALAIERPAAGSF